MRNFFQFLCWCLIVCIILWKILHTSDNHFLRKWKLKKRLNNECIVIFSWQIIQLMFLINKSNKNGNVFSPKNKNRLIQHCLCYLNSSNHQFVFITEMWRKASVRFFLINIVFDFRLKIFLIVLSTVMYLIVLKTLRMLSLTDFLNKWNKWWIFRHLLLNLNANLKRKMMMCFKIDFKRKRRSCVCWFSIFFVKTLEIFLTNCRFKLMICCFEPV